MVLIGQLFFDGHGSNGGRPHERNVRVDKVLGLQLREWWDLFWDRRRTNDYVPPELS